ncbi:hypothetical protein K474DRAFT_1658413 [Panus rudis PR-1116 ss-1]|nr:hypothetical protein K474DRAFT_1658413 [Panus rudis PR-1116 ss-1]
MLRPLSSTRLSLRARQCHRCRPYATDAATPAHVAALDDWIASEKKLILSDTLREEHLANLYVTLPTRDGTQKPYTAPRQGDNLGYGHHLVFFHPRNPESKLRADGTDADFCPPEPFTRRMWAGGEIKWHKPLRIGDRANSISTIGSVQKKGFEKGKPMVFVNQNIKYFKAGDTDASVEETRSHVYLSSPGNDRGIREVSDLPKSEFSFSYTPTPTTLFRFSALTFNGHYIHLDRDYAQKSEGYPERLVHGPLTALMLLETVVFHKPGAELKSLQYRARNPLVLNQKITMHGAWENERKAHVWAEGEGGVVGMTGVVSL